MTDILAWPTVPQLQDFRRARAAGTISVFRVRSCDFCDKEIPKQFTYCNKDCAAADAKRKAVTLIINLDTLAHGQHTVETLDGAVRTGKITKVNYKPITIDGKEFKLPESIELNADASDWISWGSIKSITRQQTQQG